MQIQRRQCSSYAKSNISPTNFHLYPLRKEKGSRVAKLVQFSTLPSVFVKDERTLSLVSSLKHFFFSLAEIKSLGRRVRKRRRGWWRKGRLEKRREKREERRGTNIARTHAQCVPRSLRPPAAPAGLSRPRHSVREIRFESRITERRTLLLPNEDRTKIEWVQESRWEKIFEPFVSLTSS